jgi:hypothetical protein
MSGRRPADGSFPACPTSGICRAQSVRTQEPCKNCALTTTSLKEFIRHQGTDAAIYTNMKSQCSVCLDLLTRLVDARQGKQHAPCFEEIVLDIYHMFGQGNVAQLYLTQPIVAPRPGDEAHARMILEELGLSCYAFNNNTEKCQYVEDIIYCKRHTPILSVNKLNKMCMKYEQSRNRKRKNGEISKLSISHIKLAILDHESQIKRERHEWPDKHGNPHSATKFKELALRKRFNKWLRKMTT